MKDMYEVEINIGDNVQVPDPRASDGWDSSFIGMVVEIYEEDGSVSIEHANGSTYEVEYHRLEVVD